jgi:PAS domain S-box-containing protein
MEARWPHDPAERRAAAAEPGGPEPRGTAAPGWRPHAAIRWAAALAVIAAALAVEVAAREHLIHAPFLIAYVAVLLSAWVGGLGPGMVATTAMTLGVATLLMHPVGTLFVAETPRRIELAVFFFTASGVSWHVDASARSRRQAALAEASLRAATRRIQEAFDGTPDAMFLKDLEGRYVLVNAGLCAMHGRSAEWLVGRRTSDVFPAAEAAALEANEREVARTGQALTFEEARPVRGELCDLLTTKWPAYGPDGRTIVGVFGHARVVTGLRRTAEAYGVLADWTAELESCSAPHDRGAALRRLAELAVPRLADGAAAFACDAAAGDVHLVGSFAKDPALASELELLGRSLAVDRSLPGPLEAIELGRALVVDCGAARERACGSLLVLPLSTRERRLGALALLCAPGGRQFRAGDLPLADEVGRRAALALDNARLQAELRRAVEQRDEALAVVSHDLRNPLTAIRLTASQLERAAVRGAGAAAPEQVARAATRILGATDRALALIRDLLDLSALESGRLAMNRAPTDLAALVRSVADLDAPLAAEKSLRLDVDARAAPELACDRDRVAQALANLVGNAIKFTPAGGRVLVTLEAAPDGGASIRVSDSGPGIPPEELPSIFERYRQGQASNHSGGVGLGLAIARGIVEAHGGRIAAENRPEGGASVWFTLPGAEAAERGGRREEAA